MSSEKDYFKGTFFVVLMALYVVIAFSLGKDIGIILINSL